MVENKEESSERVSSDRTIIKAYNKEDNYNEIVSGKNEIEALQTEAETCKMCGLTARNKEELNDHMRYAKM